MINRLAFNIAQLRHAYTHLKAGRVGQQQQFADGLISPIIQYLEELDTELKSEKQWTWVRTEHAVPTVEGWYRVLYPGDSEYIDGFPVYDFPDWESWAYWTPAVPEDYEEFDGGYKGQWSDIFNDADDVYAYCGPIDTPPNYEQWMDDQHLKEIMDEE